MRWIVPWVVAIAGCGSGTARDGTSATAEVRRDKPREGRAMHVAAGTASIGEGVVVDRGGQICVGGAFQGTVELAGKTAEAADGTIYLTGRRDWKDYVLQLLR